MIDQQSLTDFVSSYVQNLFELTSKIRDKRSLILPDFIVQPHQILCTISKSRGAAVEFGEKVSEWKPIDVRNTETSIEQEIFDAESVGTPFFLNKGIGSTIKTINLLTEEFYHANKAFIDTLTRSPNLIKAKNNFFVQIESGDVKLIDVGLAWRKQEENRIKKISCLWLFAEDSVSYLNSEKGKERALNDFNEIITASLIGTPLQTLYELLRRYSALLNNSDLREEEMQTFLEKNFVLLEAGFSKLLTKGDLRGLKMPEADFLIRKSDGSYVLIEIENPKDELFTKEKAPNPSKEFRDTITQMQGYLREVRNNMLFHKQNFPDMSVENLRGLVIIGRSSRLSGQEKTRLQEVQGTTSGFDIITFDELFENTKFLVENFARTVGWPS